MESNANEDDEMDFSMITPDKDKHKQLDFSLNGLLQNTKEQKQMVKQEPNQCKENSIKQQVKQQGSFMRDLQKMQHQLSYQTIPYDIYEPSSHIAQFTGTVQAKQEDTCTKTTNNMTNMTKLGQKNSENDFKHLIVDFTEQKEYKFKTKQSYQDYFDGEILKTKKIDQRRSQKQTILMKPFNYLSPRHNNSNKNKIATSGQYSQQVKQNSKSQTRIKKSISSKNFQPNFLKIPVTKSPISARQKSKSNTSSKSSLKPSNQLEKSKQKQQKYLISKPKNPTTLQSQVYSEYFGFSTGPSAPNRKTDTKIKGKNQKKFQQTSSTPIRKSTSKSKLKGKKIIFSKKDVHLYH